MDAALSELRLEIYRDCPLGCRHCYQAQSVGAGKEPSQLVADEPRFERLIDDFVAMGGRSVSLSGGEMLTAGRWERSRALLLTLAQRGISELRINTTLAHASPRLLLELAKLPIETLHVQTGIDGPSVHDWLRFDGSLTRTLQACRELSAHGVACLSARTTLFFGHQVGDRQLDNLGDLPWILQAAAAHGVQRLKTKVVHPSGVLVQQAQEASALWRDHAENKLAPALDDLIEARLAGRTPLRLFFTNPLPRSLVPRARQAHEADPEGVELEECRCGASHLAIDGDGLVYRCLYNFGQPELAIGNLFRESLAAIVATPKRLTYVTRARAGSCGAFDDNLDADKPVALRRTAAHRPT